MIGLKILVSHFRGNSFHISNSSISSKSSKTIHDYLWKEWDFWM